MKIFRIAVLIALCACVVPAFAQKRVLGKLGQTTAATKIYAGMTTKSHVYYHAKPYEYVVLKPSSNKAWVKVLLQTGTYGYMVAEKVAQLPYEVATQPTQGVSRGGRSSRSGSGVGTGTLGSALAGYALNFIGTPYKWGGNDEYNGIDCSGFLKKMFGKIGINLPRTAAEQVNVGQPVNRLEDLRAGDRLYFWDKKRGKVGHCGIYLGNGYFVHSSTNHKGVATDYLGTQYWLKMLVGARR